MTIILNEPADVYHANPAWGSTDVRDLIRSPRLCRDRKDKLIPFKESPALFFGTACHLALLEPEVFAASAVFKPEGMTFASNEGKAWKAEHAGKMVVPFKDAEAIRFIRERLPDEVRGLLGIGKTEVTVRNEIDGLPVQCRVDLWDMAAGMRYDLKTIDAIEKVEMAIYKHGYHIQDRWYGRVVANEPGYYPRGSRLVFAEKNPPYRWRIVDLDPDFKAMGERAIDDALAEIKARNKSGCWGDRDPVHMVACPPEWAAFELEDNDDEEDAA